MKPHLLCFVVLSVTALAGFSGCSSVPRVLVAHGLGHASDNNGRTDPKTVTFATYNVHGLREPEKLRRTLADLKFVDVWAFQEVNGMTDKDVPLFVGSEVPDLLREILPGGAWHIFHVPMNPTDDGSDVEGLTVASRFPFSSREVWRLPASKDPVPCAKRRAALAATVHLDGKEVMVINTDHEVHWSSIKPAARRLQIGELVHRLTGGHVASEMPVVMMGDFNSSGRPLHPFGMTAEEEVRQLRDALASAGLQHLPGKRRFLDTFRSLIWSHPIDHVFSKGLTCTRWGTTENYVGSDHRPLWAEFQTKELQSHTR